MNLLRDNKVNKKLKEKRGLNSIELAMIVFLTLMVVCLLIDVTNIKKKHDAVSVSANYVARTIGKQGGVAKSKPLHYPGEYITSQQLYTNVKENLNDAGISDDMWSITIKAPSQGKVKLSPNTNLRVVDYGQEMNVTLDIDYEWKMASKFLPITMKGNNTAERVTLSKFKLRENSNANSEIR